jgi:hypothetical protein
MGASTESVWPSPTSRKLDMHGASFFPTSRFGRWTGRAWRQGGWQVTPLRRWGPASLTTLALCLLLVGSVPA